MKPPILITICILLSLSIIPIITTFHYPLWVSLIFYILSYLLFGYIIGIIYVLDKDLFLKKPIRFWILFTLFWAPGCISNKIRNWIVK